MALSLLFTPGVAMGSSSQGTASDTSLVQAIRSGWPEATDLYLPSELPPDWRLSQPDEPLWGDEDFTNPDFVYAPMAVPEAICAYSVGYDNGEETLLLSAGYWPASGSSRHFHELAENASTVDIYLGSEQWKTFTYVDVYGDPSHEVLFVELGGGGPITYVEIDYRDERSRAAAESLARAVIKISRLSPFSDVPDDRQDIIVLAREGIVQGYDDDTFRPDKPVLRAQLAKMLVGALGIPVGDGAIACKFADVPLGPSSDPLYPDDFVAVAASKGIVNGFDAKTFGPYRQVTRIQMVSMVVRALEKLRPGRLVAPPADWVSDYAEAGDPVHGKNVRVAQFNGLLSHWIPWSPYDPENLEDSLWKPATRGEMAAMLYEALGGELDSLYAPESSSTSLATLRTQLLAELDPATAVYLPAMLPRGWSVSEVFLPDPFYGSASYSVDFTDGHSRISLVYPLLGDPSEAFSGYLPTGVTFQGQEVRIGYDLGTLYCQVYEGGLLLVAPPWERGAVLALAGAMTRVR